MPLTTTAARSSMTKHALTIFQELGAERPEAARLEVMMLHYIGDSYSILGDLHAAVQHFNEALPRERDVSWLESISSGPATMAMAPPEPVNL